MNKEKCCKITNTSVSLPSAFTREKNKVKRKGIFRPRSIVIEEDLPSSLILGGNKGYFTQQHNDAKVFMEEHSQKEGNIPSKKHCYRRRFTILSHPWGKQ